MKKYLKDIILGGQDGLVNVFGIILAMASATQDVRMVVISGLAATFAESLSMTGVGYTSTKALKDYYHSKLKEEKHESVHHVDEAKDEIRSIYLKKGFKGTLLNRIVQKITSDRKVMVDTMMKEELNLSLEGFESPLRNAAIIGFAAIVGSLIPLVPFFFVDNIMVAVIAAVMLSTVSLFLTGAIKAKVTVGNWLREGIELALVGMGIALVSYGIGYVLQYV
ncbi:MAG: VIT1/CCC1 transporter family protein [Nanoarchaeota archaeon]